MSSIFHLRIPSFLTTHLFLCFLPLLYCPEAYILLLFLSFLTFLVITPLFSSSTLDTRSVMLPLFSAHCDQLGDISPTDISGDRTSGGRILLHLSLSASPPFLLSTPGCLDTPAPPPCHIPFFVSAEQTADLAPLLCTPPPSHAHPLWLRQ